VRTQNLVEIRHHGNIYMQTVHNIIKNIAGIFGSKLERTRHHQDVRMLDGQPVTARDLLSSWHQLRTRAISSPAFVRDAPYRLLILTGTKPRRCSSVLITRPVQQSNLLLAYD
jgi:hypothetical protein